MDTLVSESSAPRKWPLLSVVPSSWPSCLLFQFDEAIGVTRSASPTPCPARWLESADPYLWGSFRPQEELALSLLQFPRSFWRWRVSRIATLVQPVALELLETSVRLFSHRLTLINRGAVLIFICCLLFQLKQHTERSPRPTPTLPPTCGRRLRFPSPPFKNTLTIWPRTIAQLLVDVLHFKLSNNSLLWVLYVQNKRFLRKTSSFLFLLSSYMHEQSLSSFTFRLGLVKYQVSRIIWSGILGLAFLLH